MRCQRLTPWDAQADHGRFLVQACHCARRQCLQAAASLRQALLGASLLDSPDCQPVLRCRPWQRRGELRGVLRHQPHLSCERRGAHRHLPRGRHGVGLRRQGAPAAHVCWITDIQCNRGGCKQRCDAQNSDTQSRLQCTHGAVCRMTCRLNAHRLAVCTRPWQ